MKNKELPSELTYTKLSNICLYIFIPFLVGFLIGIKYLLPFLTSIPASCVLVNHLRKDKPWLAVSDMILYVFWLTIFSLLIFYIWFERAGAVVLRGNDYIQGDMMPWLMGEASREGTPSRFIPEHILHMVVVALSSLISMGFIALFFGTILVNYMNYYVAWLMNNADKPFLLAIIGWHPWSIIRVIAFIILGTAYAIPLTSKVFRTSGIDKRKIIAMICVSILLEIADIVIKTYIGPSWRAILRENLNMPLWFPH